jgi:prepilin-type N-terminal cleavage/methylation domain-containing protein
MPQRHRTTGFTLIEAMIVVVVIGILALLAGVAYRSWIRTSHMAEAQDMVAHIRAAEESFRAENGGYLDISTNLDLGHLYPRDPGAYKTAWGATCTVCPAHQWTALAVAPQAPVAYGYALWADNTGTNPPPTLTLTKTAQPDLSGMQGQPWYVVEAVGDPDGDGKYTRIYGFSATTTLLVDNEGN